MEQRSKEWFDARKGRVTASAVGSILGLSPFAKQEDVLRRMVREYHGAPSEFTGNAATEWGTANEPWAISQYESTSGTTVAKCGFYTYEDWLGASPDGLIDDKGIIEVKCPYGLRNADSPEFKSINKQFHYYAQIQVQLLVTGRDWCHFYQWAPKGEMLETVPKDDRFIADGLKALKQFHVLYLVERDKPEKYL